MIDIFFEVTGKALRNKRCYNWNRNFNTPNNNSGSGDDLQPILFTSLPVYLLCILIIYPIPLRFYNNPNFFSYFSTISAPNALFNLVSNITQS
jgi:hypothetical protein